MLFNFARNDPVKGARRNSLDTAYLALVILIVIYFIARTTIINFSNLRFAGYSHTRTHTHTDIHIHTNTHGRSRDAYTANIGSQ